MSPLTAGMEPSQGGYNERLLDRSGPTPGMEPSQGGYNMRLLDRSGPTPGMEPSQGDYNVKLSDRNTNPPLSGLLRQAGSLIFLNQNTRSQNKPTNNAHTHTQHSRPVFP